MITAQYWSNRCLKAVSLTSSTTMSRICKVARECFGKYFLCVYPAFYNFERRDKVCFQMIFRSSIFIMDIERFMSRMNVDALSVHFKSIGQNKFKMTFIIKDLKLAQHTCLRNV